MRAIGLAALAVALISCGEVDDNTACTTAMDCDEGFICFTEEIGGTNGVCRLRKGEPCIRPRECASAVCQFGFCQ